MRAIKTIVATAVIVFALTTVAMAGAQRLNVRGQAGGGAETAQVAQTAETAQPAGAVTLSTQQFAALLHAATQARASAAAHTRAPDRTHTRTHAHAQAYVHQASQTTRATQTRAAQTTHHTETHQTPTHHTHTHHATHDGTHCDDGGSHGGCD